MALFVCVFFSSCTHKAPGQTPRYAFVGFENLSGDPSLDWAGRGAGEFLAASLRGVLTAPDGVKAAVLSPDSIGRAGQTLGAPVGGAPGISSARESAIVAGADHIVSGYIERVPAGIRITASDENEATHKTVRTVSVTGSSPFEALSLVAHRFSPQAGPPGTKSAEAFHLFCAALGDGPADAAATLGQAVKVDPDFGRAWLLLTRTDLLLGNRAGAADVIAQSRARELTPLDRAWLDFEGAALAGDRSASLAAMRKVSELDAEDIGLARSLAEAESAAGNFVQAAEVWKRLTTILPTDVNAWNQLGYTLGWSGDYNGALAALRQYARLEPGDANPLDSEGDVEYWFRDFAKAAASYSAAYAKTPAFLNGGELYKAAWAKFRAGDQTGAQDLFGEFKGVREKAKDPQIDVLSGAWLYQTGHQKEAVGLLRGALANLATSGNPATAGAAIVRGEMAAQLAVWDLLANDRAAAAKDIAAGGATNLTQTDVLVRFAVLPEATAAEWEARASQVLSAPQFAALRTAALGYALILDGKKQAAIPVWEEIVKQSPGTDFFARAVLARLKGMPVEHGIPPDPASINPFAPLADLL